MAKVIKLKNDTYLYGTIIEEGSNENGEYIKYSNGTLIQWGTIAKEGYLQPSNLYNTVQGIKWYRSEVVAVNFPKPFISSKYSLQLEVKNGASGARVLIPRIGTKSTSLFNNQLIGLEEFTSNGTSYTNLDSVNWLAIGKWK